jgi:hypothetical protein
VPAAAFANAFRNFSLSCIALVQKRLVYSSRVSGERSVAAEARNLGFEMVWLGKRIFLTPGGNGYKVNLIGICVSTRDLREVG